MDYEYRPPSLEDDYEDERWLKRKYGSAIAEGMAKFLDVLRGAETAWDIKMTPQYFLEHKKGNLNAYYAVSLDKKKSKWRLMLQMLDDDGNVATPTDNEKEFLQNVKKIRIREISDHYGKY